jgi:hypothetical protein
MDIDEEFENLAEEIEEETGKKTIICVGYIKDDVIGIKVDVSKSMTYREYRSIAFEMTARLHKNVDKYRGKGKKSQENL